MANGRAAMGDDDERRDDRETKRRRFAAAFRALLEAAGLSQVAFADQFGVAPSTVNQWAMGRSVPEPDVVFSLETWFELRPGGLSETLGYLPVGTDTPAVRSTEDAIGTDPRLPPWARRLLLNSYREIVSSLGGPRRRN